MPGYLFMVEKKEEVKPVVEKEDKKEEQKLVEDPETKEMISKNELKRRQKKREKEKKKPKKEEVHTLSKFAGKRCKRGKEIQSKRKKRRRGDGSKGNIEAIYC